MIATVTVADLSRRSLLGALRGRPAAGDVSGLRWLDLAPATALASFRPPDMRRAVLFAMWDDEHADQAFRATHPLAGRFADNGFHAVLRPLRAYGSWPGLPADTPRSRVTHHDGPVIVTTLGRLRISQAPRFLRASRPAEHAVVSSEGFLWGTAAARPPFLSTMSVWSSEDAAIAYAYSDPGAGHPKAITRQRRKDFHKESAFIRYAVISSTGTLPGAPPIDFSPRGQP